MRLSLAPALLAALCAGLAAARAQTPAVRTPPARVPVREPLVDVAQACPGVVVELRYASARNITGKPIYPPRARALLRRSVAGQLNRAQAFVQERGFSLKVWDAYRPPWAQKLLWEAIKDPAYVVPPSATGSLHSWGAAVDLTLVDFQGREVRMPTDFDSFSTAAKYDYRGGDPEIAFNLATLQRAMAAAGFRHIRDEWWHYSSSELRHLGPLDVPLDGATEGLAKAEAPAPKPPETPAPKRPASPKRLLFPP